VGASLTHIAGGGRTFVNLGLNYSSSPVSDSKRIILLPLDESVTLSLGVAHNASKTLTYSLGGAVVFSGDADVDQISQGVRFKGDFDTNVAFVLGGSLQWRF
jgi:long-subunit fatty acid transport protein